MSDRQQCRTCCGSGQLREREYRSCYGCGGSGRVFDFDRERTCSSCWGRGGSEQSVDKRCFNCGGSGYSS